MSAPVTIVTGAAGALGSAVVLHLLATGHRVAALDLARSEERLHALVAGKNAIAIAGDATDMSAWQSSLARVTAELGAPTGAALIAGTWKGGASFHTEPDDSTWKTNFLVNLATAETALRALLPGMVERKRGSIVVVGSRAALRPESSKGAAAYAASKAALLTLIETISAEVVHDGVRLNAICPSVIDTPANRSAMPKAKHETWVAPEALAKVVAFLLSDDSGPISGVAIPTYGRA